MSRGSFMPAPDVDSTVIRLDLLPEPAVQVRDEALFFQTVKAAFSQRRKTLPNCRVSGFFHLPKAEVTALLEAAEIPATARAEQLSMEQFGALCEALYDHGLRGAPAPLGIIPGQSNRPTCICTGRAVFIGLFQIFPVQSLPSPE